MALWACQACGTAYAVGVPACPQCGSSEYLEDGVAKITTGGGPSIHLEALAAEAAALAGPADDVQEAVSEPEATAPVPVAEQLAAGVPPAETVTIAAQKAGTPPPPPAGES
jgi:hypothetical protein